MASLENTDTSASQYTKEAQISVSRPELSHNDAHVSNQKASKPTEVWIRFMTFLRWYPKDMPHEEKSLTLKLDLSILIFGCLSFFTKYLDQQSITNAYVR
jgi:ACS family pantothenate transporter-like MFS transporter